jgi:acyl transferase domain-containing protein
LRIRAPDAPLAALDGPRPPPSSRSTRSDEADAVGALLREIAALHAHGFMPDWRKALGDGPRASLPFYPFQRSRHWRDPPKKGVRSLFGP